MDTTAAPALHALSGFGMGISLIAAIGAQNAFVLRQGIRREHVLPIVLVCALSDAVLIALGIAGVGAIVERMPVALLIVRWAGAAFLFGYGLLATRRAFSPHRLATDTSGVRVALWPVILTTLAITWLNPHVYLDTVLLLGSVASGHGDGGRWWFGIGAVTASIAWFAALGYGARLLRGVFARPLAWRILDGFIAAVMITLGLQLLLSA
ncbi:LysE/ArgO family amino acid transporter [Glaciibacter superstes]|uniref:LysE/ArgO family amino acid transporter n=1 Tax=Glaciibacter superstes TaxID=501023 RepID=UPI0003B389AB|nr:LysE/ArgO family amino acid transporter [Glaciibacter superstes]